MPLILASYERSAGSEEQSSPRPRNMRIQTELLCCLGRGLIQRKRKERVAERPANLPGQTALRSTDDNYSSSSPIKPASRSPLPMRTPALSYV
jgi:hypothetical protein